MNAGLTYQQALAHIQQVGAEAGFGIKPDLSRIQALVELLDHPERTYPTIHIAGTNGKTSTTRAVAAILGAHGLMTGFYTSPHLQSPRERFALCGAAEHGLSIDIIARDVFAKTLAYLIPFIHMVEESLHNRITYFETTTALAFEWMAQVAVSAGVFETGMGGSWDATNVLTPSVAVLTPIDIDHVSRLGPTALDGAKEKAGIIKDGVPVVSALQMPEVADHLAGVTASRGAPLIIDGVDFEVVAHATALGGMSASIRGTMGTYEDLFIPMFGAHQVNNVAIAIAACETFLGSQLDDEALRAALAAHTSPGRMEVVARKPTVVLDGAHNPHGVRAALKALRASFGDVPTTIVVAIMGDKDVDSMVGELAATDANFIASQANADRSMPAEQLASSTGWSDKKPKVIPDLAMAIEEARAGLPEHGLVLITGSLYAVGEARSLIVGPVA